MKAFIMRIVDDELEALDKLATDKGTNRTEVIRSLVRVAVARHLKSRAQDADDFLRQLADE